MEEQISYLHVFDLDGTITYENCDTWHLITEYFCQDKAVFLSYVNEWQNHSKTFANSTLMIQRGLDLMDVTAQSENIYELAYEVFEKLYASGKIREKAIEQINDYLDRGHHVAISTASYQEVAKALKDFLFAKKILTQERSSVLALGTVVDWVGKKLVFFNRAHNKIVGLAQKLKISEEELKDLIETAYGDDPLETDSDLLMSAKQGYVVTTSKNKNIDCSSFAERVYW